MKSLKKTMVIAIVFLFCLGMAMAQEDSEGCKDHPLLTRMSHFFIQDCETKEFDSHEFWKNEENSIAVEGSKYYISYAIKEGSQVPSELQILRNFINALKRIGGELIYQSASDAYLKMVRNGKEVWVHVNPWNDGEGYDLTIIEKKEMTQEITANDMLEALNNQGFVALYINFDTNQAIIKSESLPIVNQIAALLRDNPELEVSIEGHTDNAGTPQSNKALSLRRAEAVVNALVKQGIDKNRLSAAGWGQEKPIADNSSEEGQAKNRRVEVVKK